MKKLYLLVLGFVALVSQASAATLPFAAITWDFTSITDEIAPLGVALLAVVGLIIAGMLGYWGVKATAKPIMNTVKRFFS